jgi:oligoribonuclease
MTATPKLVFGDLETTGKNENYDAILEAGFVITDAELNIIAQKSWLVTESGWRYKLDHAVEVVREMHHKNGLIADLINLEKNEAKYSHGLAAVGDDIFNWLFDNGIKGDEIRLPLSGSTIAFDRKFLNAKMPFIDSLFHYRSIDVSSIKELCKIYNPNVYKNYQDTLGSAKKEHRVLDDIHASIRELEYYLNEFLMADFDHIIPGQEVINLP